MALTLTIRSPTIKEWLKIIRTRRRDLTNPSRQMWMLLQKIREDVDKQFDENQGSWTPLAEFTIEKKASEGGDPRILHDTREGGGLRLRDAYMQAGGVDPYGKLVYEYPVEKPYAIEHQEGSSDVDEGNERPQMGDKKPKRKRKKKTFWERLFDDKHHKEDLDEEYARRFLHGHRF